MNKIFANYELMKTGLFRVTALVCAVIYALIFGASTVMAMPVISGLKTGDSASAAREYVSIYNNSSEAQDVSGWCLVYASASDATKTNLGCLTPPANSKLMIEPWSSATFATNEFVTSVSSFSPDVAFKAGISASGGHLRLVDSTKNEVDKLGWGTAVSPEGTAITAPASGKILLRKSASDPLRLVDTNNNTSDFMETLLQALPASGLYEELLPQDVCGNIDGLQISIPDDYFAQPEGVCLQDICDNIEGLQVGVPAGYESLDGENCHEKPPVVYEKILITELKPNATGVDDGQEFIELHNPSSVAVNLEGYVLALGPTFFKTYTLPSLQIDPLGYLVLSDAQTGIILPNSSASMRLSDPNGAVVSQTDVYDSPKDDASWSLIDNLWTYSEALSPGSVNVASTVSGIGGIPATGSTEDCGPGKFRNPETNRCKTIETEDDLKVCAANQERNPETNRCRNVLTESGLVRCKEGQERNPETNRCRSVLSATSVLAPCPAGQERNPETNRCRKSGLDTSSGLSAVQDIESGGSGQAGVSIGKGLAMVAAIVALCLGYLMYEWRIEIRRLVRHSFRRIVMRKSVGTS